MVVYLYQLRTTNNFKKIEIMKATVSFIIPQFNSLGNKEINFKQDLDCETTFKNILKSFNKTLTKNWQSVEFDFDRKTILVCKHWLIETDFDFENSHQIQ